MEEIEEYYNMGWEDESLGKLPPDWFPSELLKLAYLEGRIQYNLQEELPWETIKELIINKL